MIKRKTRDLIKPAKRTRNIVANECLNRSENATFVIVKWKPVKRIKTVVSPNSQPFFDLLCVTFFFFFRRPFLWYFFSR